MGISGDIRPRKPKQIKTKPAEEPVIEEVPKLEEGEEIVQIHRHEAPAFEHFRDEKEEEIDDFFAGTYRQPEEEREEYPVQKKIKRNTQNNSKWLKVGIAVLVIILIVILVKQNLNTIYKFIGLDELLGESSPDTTNTNSYETLSTDYTNNTTGTSTNSTTSTNSGTTAISTGSVAATTPAVAPVTAPATTLNKSSVKVSVLNGNGIAGSAAGIKTTLTAAGYTISNLSNAKVFTYATTMVYYKTGKTEYATDIKNTLTSKTVEIKESNTIAGVYDLVVVAGAK